MVWLQAWVLLLIPLRSTVPGHLLITYGLLQFDKHGGDPLKRRIIDQVRIVKGHALIK